MAVSARCGVAERPVAESGGTDTVMSMRRRWVIASVCIVPVAIGVIGAGLFNGAPGAGPSEQVTASTTAATVDLGIDLDGAGPGCLGGLCTDMLPKRIEYAQIGSYLAVLRDALAADPSAETANACHAMAHEIGRRVVASGTLESLLDLDDGRCLYGYQHGVLEGWSLSGSLEQVIAGIPGACSAYRGSATVGGLGGGEIEYARGSCAHGVGHAIALQNVGSVRDAVALCAGVGAGQIGGCAGGVFMAYSSENPSQGGAAGTLQLERDEVEGLCPALEGEYATECWSKLWLLGSRVEMSAAQVAMLCPVGVASCGRGVGEGLYYETGMEAFVAMDQCPVNVVEQCSYGIAWAEANAWVGSGGRRAEYRSVCGRFEGEQSVLCSESEKAALAGGVQ